MKNLVEFNYVARGTIAAGDLVSFKTATNLTREAEKTDNTNASLCFGISVLDCQDGDIISYLPFISGQIVNVNVAGTVAVGDVLSVGSAGVVKMTDGNFKLNLAAVAAGGAGDSIPAVVLM